MSMHFAPQWVKPIKPSGTAVTPTSDLPPSIPSKLNSAPTSNVPFPALAQSQRSASPNTSTLLNQVSNPNPPLSYSRITHTPLSPGLPNDNSYFPYQSDALNGNGNLNPHPFRYSREQILALYDEEKVKERPIELVQMVDGDGVLISKSVGRPVGLRELTEVEKKLFATSIHPPAPNRRQVNHASTPNSEQPNQSAAPIRRTIAPPSVKESVGSASGRAGAFGGFGRGEGGAFGGGIIGGKSMSGVSGGLSGTGTVEGKMPGTMGGGFGGVGAGKRIGRTRPDGSEAMGDPPRASAAPSWRQPTRTASGTFEGVLGFGNSTAPSTASIVQPVSAGPASPTSPAVPTATSPDAPASGRWRDKAGEAQKSDVPALREKEVEAVAFGNGGGPGWGTGQRKWRTAAGAADSGKELSRTIEVPISKGEGATESVMATAPATPLPERDSTLSDTVHPSPIQAEAPISVQDPPAPVEKEDLSTVQWLYRDPGGSEQGPFAASQMHDWYSHSYFTDDLPVRRQAESSFHTLAELKTATGNAVQPFLSPLRPRNLPPNLPIPLAALQGIPLNGHSSINESFRNLSVHNSPLAQPQLQQFLPENGQFLPNHFAQRPFGNDIPNPTYAPAPGAPLQSWNGISPQPVHTRMSSNNVNGYNVLSPIGSAPLAYQQQQSTMYSPVIGGPIHRQANEFFSPSIGAGAIPASPWSSAQQAPQPFQQQPVMQSWQIQQPQPHPQPPIQSQTQPQQQPDVESQPADEPSYFPPGAEAESEPVTEEIVQAVEPAIVPETVAEPAIEESQPQPEEPVAKVAVPPPSVWGQKSTSSRTPASSQPPSRKSSILPPITQPAAPAATASTPSSKLPPAHASLPPKPVTQTSANETSSLPQTPEKVSTPIKTAPWATKDEDKARATPTGPSLREIQLLEAKQAEARKAAIAEARAAAASPLPSNGTTVSEELPSSMAWGLPTSNTKSGSTPVIPSPGPSTPSAPVWGSGDASAPKKTLKQIQEEEEKRKAKLAAAQRAQQVAAGISASNQKRGYADLAATPQATATSGWSTVGAGGKPTTPTVSTTVPRTNIPAKPAAAPARPPAVSAVSSSAPSPSLAQKIAKPIDDNTTPSVEFIRWTKQALNGLTGVNMDEFIQMLLTFPINPPASQKAETLQIISESVYENSSTLDGRRFALEFYDRRRADAANRTASTQASGKTFGNVGAFGGAASSSGLGGKMTSLADVVKTVPKASADLGFKVVKAKGKGKKQ